MDGRAENIFLEMPKSFIFLSFELVFYGRTGRTIFLENTKSFFSSLMVEYMFFGKIQILQGSTDGRTYFIENTKSFFPSLMRKNTIFFKENQNF